MLTLGVDLSCDMKKTAVWRLEDAGNHLDATPLRRPRTPADLLDALLEQEAEAVAIDAPFGWPEEFVRAVVKWLQDDSWLTSVDPLAEQRNTLYRRLTERLLWDRNLRPLSTSSDRIGATAMLCAWLLDQYHTRCGNRLDRVDGLIIETYPAAVLAEWQLPEKGYKAGKGRAVRREIVKQLLADAQTLEVDAERLERSDHALDALVCGLVARAKVMNRTVRPAPDQVKRATKEGWIHLPKIGLRELSAPTSASDGPKTSRQANLRAKHEGLIEHLRDR